MEAFEDSVKTSLNVLQKQNLALTFHQKQALRSVIGGKDTFVSLPTGHGKSIIFECLPHCCDHLNRCCTPSAVLVVSPLIALMETQVDDLCRRGQNAVRLVHTLSVEECVAESVRYVFVAPEALEEPRWKELLRQDSFSGRLKGIFIDEAHCIETWGSGKFPFRREYSKLATLRSFVPFSVPFVALTATASDSTRKNICASLEMKDPVVVAISPNRLNLRYSVYAVSKDSTTRFTWLLEELRSKKLTTVKTLVFCQSIASCSELYSFFDLKLQEAGYVQGLLKLENAMFGMYHAKITDGEKKTLLKSFTETNGYCRVLFCTIAFGMGINILNIHRIIHNGPSESIEAYIQESGRGGRDGFQSEVVLYTFLGCTRGRISQEMKDYCGNQTKCRRVFLMSHFSGDVTMPQPLHLCCDVCSKTCACNCVCKICHCRSPGVPCSLCCECDVKCLYKPSNHIVMPMRLICDEHDLTDFESDSTDSDNVQ
jgi:ATP-dependent DNA helicase RecQ